MPPHTISHVEQSAREKLLSQVYEELHASLSAILYEEDPLGAGSSVGSPSDEYDHEAARLAASLRQTNGDASDGAESSVRRRRRGALDGAAPGARE